MSSALTVTSPCLTYPWSPLCSTQGVRTTGGMLDTMGAYDPILHHFTAPREPQYEARKEREFQRATGGGNSGKAICADPLRASFNPILGECRPPSPAPQRTVPAVPGTNATLAQDGRPREHAATPGRRVHAMHGETWGTYNPITHAWAEKPRDSRFVDQNKVTDRKHGPSGAALGKPDTRMNQGVYNPILNVWIVPPANSRHIAGNSFAPAGTFLDQK